MASAIPMQQTTNGPRYVIGSDKGKAMARIGTVIQDPTGQWWEVTEIKAWRNNSITTDYTGFGKKVSAKYATLSKQIEDLKLAYLAAKAESTFGPAAWDFNAGAPARAKMAAVKEQLAAIDQARVAKVMPSVEVK